MTYDPLRLAECAAEIELSHPSDRSVHDSFHHGYRRNKDDRFREVFEWVLKDFEPVANAWLSHIEPGGDIPAHKDASPWLERWQIPIHPSGTFTIDGEDVEQLPGVPFQVKHWTWHSVQVGNTPRVHLVIDRDVLAHEGKGGMERK